MVKRLCVSLSLSLSDEVRWVHCFSLQSECCIVALDLNVSFVLFLIYLFSFLIRTFWQPSLTVAVQILLCRTPHPPGLCNPKKKNISSRQEMSEPIAMETVLKSLEHRPPLWLHPIRFKEKLSLLHYFSQTSAVGTSVWTWYCVWARIVCVCVCRGWGGGGIGSQKVSHHATLEFWDPAQLCGLLLLSPHAGALFHLKSPGAKGRVTPCAWTMRPSWGWRGWGAVPLQRALMLDTRLQSPQHQSRGLEIRPNVAPCLIRTPRAGFPLGSAGFNRTFLLQGTQRVKVIGTALFPVVKKKCAAISSRLETNYSSVNGENSPKAMVWIWPHALILKG